MIILGQTYEDEIASIRRTLVAIRHPRNRVHIKIGGVVYEPKEVEEILNTGGITALALAEVSIADKAHIYAEGHTWKVHDIKEKAS